MTRELHQISAYVEATNTRIGYLEELVVPSATDQIVEIKRGLKTAHRGLERLQNRFPAVEELTREVWRTYRRLRCLEEKWCRLGGDVSSRTVTKPEARVVQALPAVRSEALGGREQDQEGGQRTYIVAPYDADDFIVEKRSCSQKKARRIHELEPVQEEQYIMSGGLPAEEGHRECSTLVGVPGAHTSIVEDDWRDLIADFPMPNQVAASMGATATTNGHYVPDRGVEDFTGIADEVSRRKTVRFSEHLTKSPTEILESVHEEEKVSSSMLTDPFRRREGSADGSSISAAIMAGICDRRLYVPQLWYIKVHEVRDLKRWLVKHNHLQRGEIRRKERVLHLLILLQAGLRFETVAVLFSRTPIEVVHSCMEVFEGLLELHSETVLPRPAKARKYTYPHLWLLVGNFNLRYDERNGTVLYPWDPEDLLKVLVTLSIYIGRYRAQGRFALDGKTINWGKYMECPADWALETLCTFSSGGSRLIEHR